MFSAGMEEAEAEKVSSVVGGGRCDTQPLSLTNKSGSLNVIYYIYIY